MYCLPMAISDGGDWVLAMARSCDCGRRLGASQAAVVDVIDNRDPPRLVLCKTRGAARGSLFQLACFEAHFDVDMFAWSGSDWPICTDRRECLLSSFGLVGNSV